jgi:hypothetical protein
MIVRGPYSFYLQGTLLKFLQNTHAYLPPKMHNITLQKTISFVSAAANTNLKSAFTFCMRHTGTFRYIRWTKILPIGISGLMHVCYKYFYTL